MDCLQSFKSKNHKNQLADSPYSGKILFRSAILQAVQFWDGFKFITQGISDNISKT